MIGIQVHGTKNWTAVATFVPGRSPKQCRERWTGQLDPSLNRDSWDQSEDSKLFELHNHLGNAWAKISSFLPGRSANSVKNRYKLLLKRGQTSFNNEFRSPNKEPEMVYDQTKHANSYENQERISIQDVNLGLEFDSVFFNPIAEIETEFSWL